MKESTAWEHVMHIDEGGNLKEERWIREPEPVAAEWMLEVDYAVEKLESALIHAQEESLLTDEYVSIALEWTFILKRLILEVGSPK